MADSIPSEVLSALGARNPFKAIWDDPASLKRFQDTRGPAREIAERLLSSLAWFPPPSPEFEVLEILAGLGGTGYTVTVGSGTHLRVTMTAKYREARQSVGIRDFSVGRRMPERIRRGIRIAKKEMQ